MGHLGKSKNEVQELKFSQLLLWSDAQPGWAGKRLCIKQGSVEGAALQGIQRPHSIKMNTRLSDGRGGYSGPQLGAPCKGTNIYHLGLQRQKVKGQGRALAAKSNWKEASLQPSWGAGYTGCTGKECFLPSEG